MSKHRVAVLKVVSSQSSVTAAAAEYEISRQHLHRLLRRYREGGLDAVEPRSRRPLANPGRTPERVRARIVELRTELSGGGLDAGPMTIAWHLGREGYTAPSTSTIRRILHAAGSSFPSRASARAAPGSASRPRRPTSSGSPTSPTGGSRMAPRSRSSAGSTTIPATCSAAPPVRRVAGDDVVATFTAAGDAHGWPAATLTDNAAVYTSRFTGGRNGFEYLLAYLGIRQKNGAPGHPQTQGKIERFQQTLKRWLERQPAARSLGELQAQLDRFRLAYNEHRPHRATGRITPAEAYAARPKAHPAGRGAPGHFRLRYDTTDSKGTITLRRAGRLHHLNIGATHARRRVLAIVDEQEVTVVALGTGEILSTHLIEPDRRYWRNQRRDPGRWPGSQATD